MYTAEAYNKHVRLLRDSNSYLYVLDRCPLWSCTVPSGLAHRVALLPFVMAGAASVVAPFFTPEKLMTSGLCRNFRPRSVQSSESYGFDGIFGLSCAASIPSQDSVQDVNVESKGKAHKILVPSQWSECLAQAVIMNRRERSTCQCATSRKLQRNK